MQGIKYIWTFMLPATLETIFFLMNFVREISVFHISPASIYSPYLLDISIMIEILSPRRTSDWLIQGSVFIGSISYPLLKQTGKMLRVLKA